MIDLYNHSIGHQQIKAITTIEPYLFKHHRQWFLSLKMKFPQPQLMTEAFFICGFQQTRPQGPMNLYRRANDLFGQVIDSHYSLCALCASAVNLDSTLPPARW